MKNKIDYSKLSDFEINKAVAKFEGWAVLTQKTVANQKTVVSKEGGVYLDLPDYCNSWADMGPIIESNRISIIFDDLVNTEACSDFSVDRFSYGYSSKHWDDNKNPLRAAAIVYLMIGDEDEE